MLDNSSFYKLKIKGTVFRHCRLLNVDFSECDLTSSLFDDCDLAGAVFGNTVIAKADFTTSYNYSIDPELNRIRKAKFSLPGVTGLLDKYDIVIK
jgi:uncharacterized protein YjbI with pentapeptide repeats